MRRRARRGALSVALALSLVTVAFTQSPGIPPKVRATAAEVPPDTPFEPHRIAGNLYYVGTKGLAVYLITTPAGHILINGTYPASVPLVSASISRLGFKPTDVRYLLQSHAHPDHVSGNADLKAATGARVLVMDDDVEVIRTGGRADFQYPTQELFPPGPVDQVLHDAEHVRLGGMDLQAIKTPGHTRGCTTWRFKIAEGQSSREVVILCSINFNPGYKLIDNAAWPDIAAGFRHTYSVVAALRPDIWLAPHPFMFDMERKHARLASSPDSYVDAEGYRSYVAARKKDFGTELARQEMNRPR